MSQFFPPQAPGPNWHVDAQQHQIMRPPPHGHMAGHHGPPAAPPPQNWQALPNLFQQGYQQQQLQLQQAQLQQQQLLHQQQMQQQQRLQEQWGMPPPPQQPMPNGGNGMGPQSNLLRNNVQHNMPQNNMGSQQGPQSTHGNHGQQPQAATNILSATESFGALNQTRCASADTRVPPPSLTPAVAPRLAASQSIQDAILRPPPSTPHPPAAAFTPNPGAPLFHPGVAPGVPSEAAQTSAVPLAPSQAPQSSLEPTPAPPQPTETTIDIADFSMPRRRSPLQIRLPGHRSAFITELPSRAGSEPPRSPPRERPLAEGHLKPSQVLAARPVKASAAVLVAGPVAAPRAAPQEKKAEDKLLMEIPVWNRPEAREPTLTVSIPRASGADPLSRPRSTRYDPSPPEDGVALTNGTAQHRKTPFGEKESVQRPKKEEPAPTGWPKATNLTPPPPAPDAASKSLLPPIDFVKVSPTPQKVAATTLLGYSLTTETPSCGIGTNNPENSPPADETGKASKTSMPASPPVVQTSKKRIGQRSGNEPYDDIGDDSRKERESERDNDGNKDGVKTRQALTASDLPNTLAGSVLRYIPRTDTVESRWEAAPASTSAPKKKKKKKGEAGATVLPDAKPIQVVAQPALERSVTPQAQFGRDVVKYAQGGYGRYSPKPADLIVGDTSQAAAPVAPSPPPKMKAQHEAVLALLNDVNDKLRSRDAIYRRRAPYLSSSPPSPATSTRVATLPSSGRSTPVSPSPALSTCAPSQPPTPRRPSVDGTPSSFPHPSAPAQPPPALHNPHTGHDHPTPLDTFHLLATGETRARPTAPAAPLDGFRITAELFTAFSRLVTAHVDMAKMLTSHDTTPEMRQTLEPTLRACSHHLDALHHTLLLTSHIRAEAVRSAWVELGARPPEF